MAGKQNNPSGKRRVGHHPLLRRLWRISAGTIAAIIIVMAIAVGLLRFSAPMLPAWRADAEQMVTDAIGFPVQIGELDLQFDWLQPEIVLRDIALLDPDGGQPLVTAAQLSVIVDATDLLHITELRPHRIRILSPRTAITVTGDEQILLGGFALPKGNGAGRDWRELLELVLQRVDVEVLDASIRFQYLARDIEDWEVRDLDLRFSSDGDSHAISIDVLPPSLLGKTLELDVEAQGPPGRPEAWQWQASVLAQRVDIATLRQQVRWQGLGKFSGNFDVRGEFSGIGAGNFSGNGELEAADLLFGGFSDAPEPIDRLAFNWELRHDPAESELRLDRLVLERDSGRWPESYLSLDWHHPETEPHRLELVANYLSLDELRVIAASLPRGQNTEDWTLFDWIAEVQPEGQVSGLILDVPLDVPLDDSTAGWRIEGEFENLKSTAVRGLPGIEGLSGRISGLNDSGMIRLQASDVVLQMPDMFRDPVPVDSLVLEAGWRRLEDQWRFTTDRFEIELPLLSASAAVQLDVPDAGKPEIAMTATVRNLDLGQKSAFLPVGTMSEDLVTWLDRGVVAGKVPTADILWKGPVAGFPYRDGGGKFDISFTLEDTVIDYVPGWPRIEGLRADVEFFGPGMRLEILEGRTANLQLESGTAVIPEFRDNQLEINAEITGDTADMEEFVKAAPIAGRLKGVTENVELSGPATAMVNIHVPLMHSIDTSLEIDLALNKVRIQPVMLPWPINDLSGNVRVTEKGAWAENLQGSFHDQPLQASLASELQPADETNGSLQRVRVNAIGTAQVDLLEQWLPAHWRPPLAGRMDFSSEIVLPVHAEGVPTVQISSPMIGLASNLPQPLAKPAGLSWPAEFTLTAPSGTTLNLQGTLRDDLAFRLAFARGEQEWFIERGTLEVGTTILPELPGGPGVFIRGRLNEFAPLQWIALEQLRETSHDGSQGQLQGGQLEAAGELQRAATTEPEQGASLREVDVTAGRMMLGSFPFSDQRFALTQTSAGWNISLDGDALQGSVAVPRDSAGHDRIELDLERVYLELPEGVDLDGSESDPRDFPAAQVDIRDFRIGRIKLGHVKGLLKRSNIGFVTDNLTATGPAHRIAASGRWEYLDDKHYTSVKAEMNSSDLEAALSALGYRAGIEADDAHATMDLTWHAPPFGWAPERLNGEVSLDFNDGRIEEVSQGAGRIFGLLSIGALPRRLLLDFTDVFESGLPFDTLTGDFIITDGSAYTTNLRMKGPSMAALIVGRTGIAAKDYDQLVIVDPNVSGSLPLAGALAAGPNVGAAILLLSQLLKAPLSDIAQVKYRITGSWEDPQITKVEAPADRRASPAQTTGQETGATTESRAQAAETQPLGAPVSETSVPETAVLEKPEQENVTNADEEAGENDQRTP